MPRKALRARKVAISNTSRYADSLCFLCNRIDTACIPTHKLAASCSTLAPMPRSSMASTMPPLRLCAHPSCGRWYASALQPFCCSQCGDGLPMGKHTKRCRRHQRFLAKKDRSRQTICRVPDCNRPSSIGHRTCCSACSPTMGQEHTGRCNWMSSQGPARMPTQSLSSTDRDAENPVAGAVTEHPAHNNGDREDQRGVQADREKPSCSNAAGSTNLLDELD